MSIYNSYRKIAIENGISVSSKNVDKFFKNYSEIKDFCTKIQEKYNDVFNSPGVVLKTLIVGGIIKRCHCCRKHMIARRAH